MTGLEGEKVSTAKQLLKTLVAFDTTSRNSNLELIGWVEAYLSEHGIASERVYDDTGKKANLWATIGPRDVPGYVLSGHTDVVPVDGQDWSTDPFDLTEKDGRLFGRGACDMKGFLACVLAKAPDMAAAPLSAPIHLAFSYDEEVGCIGVRGLLRELKKASVKPKACFVGEPTLNQVVIGHKGKISFNAKVTGKAAHSSLAPEGVNAVDYGARLVLKVREIADRLAERGARDALYDVPFSTGHTGIMQGGTALNIVPDHCDIAYEFRTIKGDDGEALAKEVEDFARTELEPAMKAVALETGIVIELNSHFAGLDTPEDTEVTTLAKRFAGRNDVAKVAYGTEAGLFVEMAGVPTVVCGPGSIEQAHKPNEFIAVSELDKCCAFIGRLIAHAAA